MVEITDEQLKSKIDVVNGRLEKYENPPIGTRQLHNLWIFPDGEIISHKEAREMVIRLHGSRDLLTSLLEGRNPMDPQERSTE